MRIPARTTIALLLLIAAAVLLVGCGSDDADGSKERVVKDASGETTGKVAAVDAKLDVKITEVGGEKGGDFDVPTGIRCTKSIPATCTESIECPAAEGDDQGLAVCTWLAIEGRAALAATPVEGEACTMQYGGPAVATITGTLDGEPVDASFTRQDGCAISRFEAVSPLWTGEVPSSEPPSDGPPTTPAADGGAAAGTCLAQDPDAPVSSDAPDAGGSNADDTSCAVPAPPATNEPEVISDPPEAFE